MKRTLKKSLAIILAAATILCCAPLSGIADLDLPEFGGFQKLADSVSDFFDGFSTKAEATGTSYEGRCGDNLTYRYDYATDTLTVTGYGDMYDGQIIDVEANEGASVGRVVLPEGLTSIGDNAFKTWVPGRPYIENIPSTVKEIGSYAFSCCEFDNIVIPDSVEHIGDFAFRYTEAESIVLPEGLKIIGDFAFGDCWKVNSLTIPESVETIGAFAFHDCNIKSITIPEGVKSIGIAAFSCMDALEEINFYAVNCEITGYTGRYRCYSLNQGGFATYSATHSLDKAGIFRHETGSFSNTIKTVNIGSKVKTVPADLLTTCIDQSTEFITLPDFATDIDLSKCLNLKQITVSPDNRYLSSDAYGVLFNKDKTKLICYPKGNTRKSYIIPKTVTSINDDAFKNCFSLESIFVDLSNASYSSDEAGILFNKNKSKLIRCPAGNKKASYQIPNSVTSIGDYAFDECKTLESVTIGNSVTSIGDYAFAFCDSLTSITIPDSVTSIGYGMFGGCTNLTSVTIPDNVTSIGDCAFASCDSLTSITIPDSVTSIGDYAFGECMSLTSVTIPDSVTSIGSYAFYYCDSLTDVYYTGTETEWNAISIGYYNSCLTNATIHYNYKSVAVTGIDIPQSKIQMNGETMVIGATVYPENATNKKIKWISSNPDVAAIDAASGTLTAKANGYTVVTARTADGNCSDSCIVFVGENTMVVSSEDGNEIKKGDTHKIYVSLVDLDCISMSDNGIEIERISGDLIDKTIFAVADSSVATIKSISEWTHNGRILEIKGVSPGTTYITMTNNDTGEVKYLPIYVQPKENTYTTETIPATDEGHRGIKNFRHNGIYIYDYQRENNDDGSVDVKFNAYNNNTNNGSVEVYNEDGTIDKSYMLEAHNGGDPTSVDENCEMIGAILASWVNLDPLDPTNMISSTKTEVDCTVPKNGYIKITNDVTDSKICLVYNIMDLVVSTVSLSGDISGFADLDSETAKKVVEKTSEKVIKAILDTSGSTITKIIGKIIDELSKPETLENRETLFDLIEQLLDVLDLKFEEILVESIWDVTKKKITDLGLDALGVYGKTVKGLYAYNAFLQLYNLILESDESIGSYSAYIYAKQNGDKKVSNSIIFKGESDAETVFRTYAIAYGDIYVEMSTLYGAEDMELYDISLVKDGNTVQPSEKVQVSIPIPGDWDKNKVKVYRVTLDGAYMQYEDMKGKVDGNYIVFETDHFSYYAVVEENSVHTHSYTSTITTPATCTENGVMTYTCECGDSYTQSIPAKGHVPNAWEIVVSPTCTEKGEKNKKCINCSEVFETVEIPARGHSAGEWETILEPTTEMEGKKVKKCTVCGLTLTEKVIDKLPTENSFDFELQKPSTTTISYGDSIILHADIDGELPSGYYVEWTADNDNFSYTADGATCEITPEKSGDTTFTATIYDAENNPVSTDEQTMTSKAGFFQKILAFFKGIFGLNKTYPNVFKF